MRTRITVVGMSKSQRYLVARFLNEKATYASRQDVRQFVTVAIQQVLYDYRPSLTARQRATVNRLEQAANETVAPPQQRQRERQMNLFVGGVGA